MIDWNRVTELRDEIGAEDFADVAEIFLEEVDEEIAKIGQPDYDGDLAADFHFLKGGALNLGFADFATLCGNAEADSRNDTFDTERIAGIVSCYHASRQLFQDGAMADPSA